MSNAQTGEKPTGALSPEEIERRVLDVVRRELFSVDSTTAELSSRLKEDLGADSLDMAELVMAIEDEFSSGDLGWEIPEEGSSAWVTVADVVDYLAGRL